MDVPEFLAAVHAAKVTIINCGLQNRSQLRTIRAMHREIVRRNPANVESLSHYGYSSMALGILNDCVDFLQQFVGKYPDSRLGHYFLYLGLYRRGREHWTAAQQELLTAKTGMREDEKFNREILADLLAASEPASAIGLCHSDGNVYILTEDGAKQQGA